MSAAIIVILTIINAMLVATLLSQARQHRKVINAYKEQTDGWHEIAVDAISKNLESKAYRADEDQRILVHRALLEYYRVDESGNLSEGDIFRYQGERNGD